MSNCQPFLNQPKKLKNKNEIHGPFFSRSCKYQLLHMKDQTPHHMKSYLDLHCPLNIEYVHSVAIYQDI